MARVTYRSAADAEGDALAVFKQMEESGRPPINLHRALGNAPGALRNFLRLGNSLLLFGQLSPALRELAILRIAQMAGADYEWLHHLPLAAQAGVRDEQVAALSGWPSAVAFDEREKAVLRYVEAVSRDIAVPDDVFSTVRKHLGEGEVVELTLVCGYWGMAARLLRALEIDVEPEFQT